MRHRTRALLGTVWALITRVSVWVKIMGIALSMVMLLGVGLTLQVRIILNRTLTSQLEERGISMARNLATRSTDLILVNDTFGLYQLLRDTVDDNRDVRYAFLLDAQGRVIVHSFGRGFPPDLVAANSVPQDLPFYLEVLRTEEGLIRDVAMPVFQGRAGTARLGLSDRYLQQRLAQVTRQFLLITLAVSLVGIVSAYALSKVLIKPITQLVEATRAVANGDFSRRISPWAEDELGHLGASFNTMVGDLATARRRSEDWQEQLVRRNQELSALNEVARLANQRLDPEQTLEQALRSLLEVTGQTAGWACLLGKDSSSSAIIISPGPSGQESLRRRHICSGQPLCRETLRERYPLVVERAALTCPLAQECLARGNGERRLVLVPLVSHPHALGLLGIAWGDREAEWPRDQEFLTSVGRQVGLAIQNAHLWEELKRKEEMRGRLLDKVIAAQEEERRRVARELHDQMGQMLTSLMVGLKVVEGVPNPDQARALSRDLRELAAATLDGVHSLVLELRPTALDDLGLVAALERYFTNYAASFGLKVDFQAMGMEETRLAPQLEITLYRIVQEALTNVARHAQAEHVSVLLERKRDSVVAIIEDDGQGFDVERALRSGPEGSLGLYGMQERASLLGGTLTLESSPGAGASVFVQIPLAGARRWENEEHTPIDSR